MPFCVRSSYLAWRASPYRGLSPGFELGNVLPSTIREVCLLVHVLNLEEAECHQFVPRLDGEVRDHQIRHEAVRIGLVVVGLY